MFSQFEQFVKTHINDINVYDANFLPRISEEIICLILRKSKIDIYYLCSQDFMYPEFMEKYPEFNISPDMFSKNINLTEEFVLKYRDSLWIHHIKDFVLNSSISFNFIFDNFFHFLYTGEIFKKSNLTLDQLKKLIEIPNLIYFVPDHLIFEEYEDKYLNIIKHISPQNFSKKYNNKKTFKFIRKYEKYLILKDWLKVLTLNDKMLLFFYYRVVQNFNNVVVDLSVYQNEKFNKFHSQFDCKLIDVFINNCYKYNSYHLSVNICKNNYFELVIENYLNLVDWDYLSYNLPISTIYNYLNSKNYRWELDTILNRKYNISMIEYEYYSHIFNFTILSVKDADENFIKKYYHKYIKLEGLYEVDKMISVLDDKIFKLLRHIIRTEHIEKMIKEKRFKMSLDLIKNEKTFLFPYHLLHEVYNLNDNDILEMRECSLNWRKIFLFF